MLAAVAFASAFTSPMAPVHSTVVRSSVIMNAPKAESYAEYLARRNGQDGTIVPTSPVWQPPLPADATPPADEVSATFRRAIHKAESFAEYVARREAQSHNQAAAVAPGMSAEQKASLKAQRIMREVDEDAALPPIAPGSMVRVINRDQDPRDAWVQGRTGQVQDFDPIELKYRVWLPHYPSGYESPRERPILMYLRRSHLMG